MNRRTILTTAILASAAGVPAARADTATPAPAPSPAAPAPNPAPALPPAPIDKSAVGYQDVPKYGQVCAACVYFVFMPANGPIPASRCKMVAGPIAPSGWCQIWQPKG